MPVGAHTGVDWSRQVRPLTTVSWSSGLLPQASAARASLDHSPAVVSLVAYVTSLPTLSPPLTAASYSCSWTFCVPGPPPRMAKFQRSKTHKPYPRLNYIKLSCSLYLKRTSRLHRAFGSASYTPNLLEGRVSRLTDLGGADPRVS